MVLIGPNDDSKSSDFERDYLRLMSEVARIYGAQQPKPQIFHVCAGSGNGLDPCVKIRSANEARFDSGPRHAGPLPS